MPMWRTSRRTRRRYPMKWTLSLIMNNISEFRNADQLRNALIEAQRSGTLGDAVGTRGWYRVDPDHSRREIQVGRNNMATFEIWDIGDDEKRLYVDWYDFASGNPPETIFESGL